jgi:hypothetical protein
MFKHIAIISGTGGRRFIDVRKHYTDSKTTFFLVWKLEGTNDWEQDLKTLLYRGH